MHYYPPEVTVYSKLFNLIQDMTKCHKQLHNALQEMAMKNSDEFMEVENISTNLLDTCQELKKYLQTLPASYH